jgi:hypothetical protein
VAQVLLGGFKGFNPDVLDTTLSGTPMPVMAEPDLEETQLTSAFLGFGCRRCPFLARPGAVRHDCG